MGFFVLNKSLINNANFSPNPLDTNNVVELFSQLICMCHRTRIQSQMKSDYHNSCLVIQIYIHTFGQLISQLTRLHSMYRLQASASICSCQKIKVLTPNQIFQQTIFLICRVRSGEIIPSMTITTIIQCMYTTRIYRKLLMI